MDADHLLVDFGEPDERRELESGEYLFRRGDASRGAFLLETGAVDLVRVLESGSELTLHRARPGASFAEAALFSRSYHCDCRARAASVVARFSSDRVLSVLRADPELALRWTRRLARQVRGERAMVEVRSILSAEERILAYLALSEGGERGPQPPTLRALAAELGLAEETVYRTVARLVERGAIVRQGASLSLSGSGT